MAIRKLATKVSAEQDRLNMSVLNATLFSAMTRTFTEVRVTSPGEPFEARPGTPFTERRAKNVKLLDVYNGAWRPQKFPPATGENGDGFGPGHLNSKAGS
ncbi:MAG: hypothetical protein K8U57_35535, partial [Planctomycetes bacterium]|nr:hypothetical protein [Planctomycetota bacterium]